MEPTFWLRTAANYVQTDSGRAYFVRPTLEVPTQGKPSQSPEQGFAPEMITDNRTRKNNRLFFNSQLLTDNHVTDFLGSGI